MPQIVARFVGEVMGMQTDLVTIEAELGAAVDAISGDIPGRKITTSLVGRLPVLCRNTHTHRDPTRLFHRFVAWMSQAIAVQAKATLSRATGRK